MNWYSRFVFSQDLPSYLQSLGASNEIVQFVTSIPDKKQAQFYVNEFRKNPAITLEQLQGSQSPEAVDPYTPQEYQLADAGPPEMRQWVLVQLRKLRAGQEKSRSISFHQINSDFVRKLEEIQDWYTRSGEDIQIESYTAEQAIAASDEWHAVMAGEGEGKIYAPTNPELVAYGPQWKNEEYNGWTIQEVRSENDLSTEGNRMDHCVGSYCEQVEKEELKIYSLRDPQNDPHLTIEIDNTGKLVKHIKGHSNSEPKDKYKPMVKEWVENSPTAPKQMTGGDPVSELPSYADMDDMIVALERIGNADEYGLQAETTSINWDSMMEIFISEAEKNNNTFHGQITEVPEGLVDAAIRVNDFNSLEHALSNLQEEYQDKFNKWGNDFDANWPNDVDYESTKEYEAALEEAQTYEQDAIDEAWRNWLPGGFLNAMWTAISEGREKGTVPPFRHKDRAVA